jgi:hypothetical protein
VCPRHPPPALAADATAILIDSQNGRTADETAERREMHVDRRKSDFDLIEHVIKGVLAERVRATARGHTGCLEHRGGVRTLTA